MEKIVKTTIIIAVDGAPLYSYVRSNLVQGDFFFLSFGSDCRYVILTRDKTITLFIESRRPGQ